MKRRAMAIILVVTMLVSMFPATAEEPLPTVTPVMTENVVDEATTAPEEADEEVATDGPAVSEEEETTATAEPEAQPTPDAPETTDVPATEVPEAMPGSDEDAEAPNEPVATDVPGEDDASDAAGEVEAPEKPTVTEAPVATEVPEETEAPMATEAPEATVKPEDTEAPTATEAPEVPEVTEAPEVTDEPEATEVPEATETPEVTEEPTPTEAPAPLELSLATKVRSAFVGDPIPLTITTVGGAGELTALCRATVNGEPLTDDVVLPLNPDGTTAYTLNATIFGDYTITITVTDGADQTAQASVTVPVAEHDTDSLARWTNRAKNVDLQGDWRVDLAAVAKTQLGYAQSDRDFIVAEDGSRQFYSVYGDWSGSSYAPWNTRFIAFCEEYAEIPASAFPRGNDVAAMLASAKSLGIYETGKDYAPSAGDVLFLADEENRPVQAGIVTSVSESGVYAVGVSDGAVVSKGYRLDDPAIIGYASMEAAMRRAGLLVEEEPDPLEAISELAVKSAFVGDEIVLNLSVAGGEGELTALYELTVDGEQKTDQESVLEGENTYIFTPVVMGEYTIVTQVTDEADQTVETVVTLPVAEHDTTSLGEWTSKADAVTLTGDWRSDVVAVARTQLGYAESETDFIVLEDNSRRNYSVYGAWYGTNYQDWNAEFVSFVLAYAKVPASAIPQSASAAVMRSAAQGAGVYRNGDYTPEAGDVAFLAGDRVGIVTGASQSGVQVMEGNSDGTVSIRSYASDAVVGYGSMVALMALEGVLVPPHEAAACIERGQDALYAQDGKVYYARLQDAIDDAAAGETIQLLRDVVENIVSENKSYTLNMSRTDESGALQRYTVYGDRQGSVYTIRGGSVTLSTGILQDGLAQNGGGLYAENATVTLDGMSLTRNQATGNGGGLYAVGSTVTFVNNANRSSYLSENRATGNGGAIYADGSAIAFNEAAPKTDTITANHAGGSGGGIALANGSSLTMNHYLYLYENTAGSFGGGMDAENATIATTAASSIYVFGNSAQSGGGMSLRGGSTMSVNGPMSFGRFKNTADASPNTATQDGGSVYVDGATLTMVKGSAIRNGSAGRNGGGLAVMNGATADLQGLTVEDNRAGGFGGGIYADGAVLVDVRNSSAILRNEAQSGGGIYAVDSKDVKIRTSVSVSGNRATDEEAGMGGGVAASGTTAFYANSASVSGNSAVYGGGIALSGTAEQKIWYTPVTGNTASESGGGIYADGVKVTFAGNDDNHPALSGNTADTNGGGIAAVNGADVNLSKVTVADNTAGTGGGLYAEDSKLTVKITAITGNKANDRYSAYGGGIYASGSTVSVSGDATVIERNEATSGAGIYLTDGISASIADAVISGNTTANSAVSGNSGSGGGLYLESAASSGKVTLKKLTVSGNTSSDGAAMYAEETALEVTDCAFTGNTATDSSYGTPYVIDLMSWTNLAMNFTGCQFTGNEAFSSNSTRGNTIEIDTAPGAQPVKFTNCDISGNQAGSIGGIDYFGGTLHLFQTSITGNTGAIVGGMNIYSRGGTHKVLLYESVITENVGQGSLDAAGGIAYNGRTWILELNRSAVYGNTSSTDGNDFAISAYVEFNLIPASEMMVNGSKDFFATYGWQYVNPKSGNRVFSKDWVNYYVESDASAWYYGAYLTAVSDKVNVAEYNKTRYETIKDAVDAAVTGSEKPAKITLIAGETATETDEDRGQVATTDERRIIRNTETASVSVPVALNLNGRTVETDGVNETIFSVVTGGSLTITGAGTLRGVIDTQIPDALTIAARTGDLTIQAGSGTVAFRDAAKADEDGIAPVTLADGFAGGAITLRLDASIIETLNSADSVGQCATLVKGAEGRVALEQVTVENIDKSKVVLAFNQQGDLVAYCRNVDGVFMGKQKDAPEGAVRGTYEDPVQTFSEAIEILNKARGGETARVIYILDEADNNTFTVAPEDADWSADKAVTIKRFSLDKTVTGNPLITVSTTLTIGSGVTIDGDTGEYGYTNGGSLINVTSNGNLTINGATLQNNDVSETGARYWQRSGGAVYSEGKLTMISGTIQNCTALMGGGVYLGKGGHFTLSDGDIKNNKAVGSFYDSFYPTTAFMSSGGGVCVNIKAEMTMEGGKISGNTSARDGGGIALGNYHLYESQGSGVDTALTMTGGTLSGNDARENGGGLFIQCSFVARISGGDIIGNTCGFGNFGGGGIYVNGSRSDAVDAVLYLTNVEITGNTTKAGSSAGGGGFAGCGSSRTLIYLLDGGLIYGNHSSGGATPDDVLIAFGDGSLGNNGGFTQNPPPGRRTPEVEITEFMPDGTPYRWRSRSTGELVTSEALRLGNGKKDIISIYTGETPSDSARSKMTVHITGNSAEKRGGGIGSNGTVIIGTQPVEISFTVRKNWAQTGKPATDLEQVSIWLVKVSADGAQLISKNDLYVNMDAGSGGLRFRQWRKNNEAFTFEHIPAPGAGETYLLLEEGIFEDGLHIWSGVDETSADFSAIKACIDAYMAGAEWIWASDDSAPYTTTVEGTVEDKGDLTITNTPKQGSLTVKKTVTDRGDKTEAFSFTVTVLKADGTVDTTFSGVYGDMEFISGVASFTLAHGGEKTATDLPTGLRYEVKETDAKGHTVTYTSTTTVDGKDLQVEPGTGETVTGKTVDGNVTVEFVNDKPDEGKLTVTKTVSGTGGDRKQAFHFKVTMDVPDGDYGDMTFKGGVAEFTLKHGESMTATNLPLGKAYTVEETDGEGYTVTLSGVTADAENPAKGEGTITRDSTVNYNNDKEALGDLQVTKTVPNQDGCEQDFRFTVTLSDTTINGVYGEMTFTDGVAEFTLRHGESKTATGLPARITYRVEEQPVDGFKTVATGDEGVIMVDQTKKAEFVNYVIGDLTVSKTVEGPGDNSGVAFTFTVALSDETIEGTYGDMTFTAGVATIELCDGERATATGLPVGITYEVTETPADNYDVITPATGTASGEITTTPSEAAFTNKRQTGDLAVSKTVTGTAGDPEKAFTFTVTLSDETVEGTYGDMTFADGVATFTLKDGETKIATGLPAGIGYTVEESDNDGYTVTGSQTSGEIAADTTAEAAFTNHKDATPTPTPTATPTPTPTATPTATPEPTETPAPTDTPEPTETPAPTDTPVPTETPVITETPAPTITPVPTETPEPQYMSISGVKTWKDNDDALGLRPTSVTVRLLRNGEVIEERTVTEADGWSYTFDDLLMLDERGVAYTYSVSERAVSGYYAMTNGYDLLNVLAPQEVEIPPEHFRRLTTPELEKLLRLFDYDIPLFGILLGTGLERPAYPYIFAGIGCFAMLILLIGRRKRGKRG